MLIQIHLQQTPSGEGARGVRARIPGSLLGRYPRSDGRHKSLQAEQSEKFQAIGKLKDEYHTENVTVHLTTVPKYQQQLLGVRLSLTQRGRPNHCCLRQIRLQEALQVASPYVVVGRKLQARFSRGAAEADRPQ